FRIRKRQLLFFQLAESGTELAHKRFIIRRVGHVFQKDEFDRRSSWTIDRASQRAQIVKDAFNAAAKLRGVIPFRVVLIDRNGSLFSSRGWKKVFGVQRLAFR